MKRDEAGCGFVSEAEAEAARRLADALEGGDGAGADAEALAAVRLLSSLGERPGDDLAARRGAAGAALAVRAASRRRLAVRLLAPLAAALVLAAGLAGSRRSVSPHVPDEVLAAKEAEARAALESLATDPAGFREARADSLLAGLSASRFDAYRRERSSGIAGTAASQPSPRETPTGGRS